MRLASDNPMRTPLMIVLIFEVVVYGLSIPVMIFISDVPGGLAGGLGGAAGGLALVSAALLRTAIGFPVAWLTQLAGIALGIATSTMFIVGGMFAGIWILIFVLGRRLEAQWAAGNPDQPAG